VPLNGVEVAVLGPVTVRGAPEPFHRSAALELVAYLAFHRRGVRHADWALAVWPDRAIALPTVHSTASDARRALGRAPDGTPHLSRGVHLRLHDSVTTDVERFASLADSEDLHRIVEAMRLVRGPLFEGLRRSDWAVFDGTQSRIESLVVGTALRGAEELVRCGCGGEAAWVVRQALKMSPYDERLYRSLLRATAAEGNRVGLRSTMAELLTLAGEPEPPGARLPRVVRGGMARLECLHPTTTALYRGLLEGSPAARGDPVRL
jgi:DNA-binding SARP family transcriptional activator